MPSMLCLNYLFVENVEVAIKEKLGQMGMKRGSIGGAKAGLNMAINIVKTPRE